MFQTNFDLDQNKNKQTRLVQTKKCKVTRFKRLSLPWFDTCKFVLVFVSSSRILFTFSVNTNKTTTLQLFIKQRLISKFWKQPRFEIPVHLAFYIDRKSLTFFIHN